MGSLHVKGTAVALSSSISYIVLFFLVVFVAYMHDFFIRKTVFVGLS